MRKAISFWNVLKISPRPRGGVGYSKYQNQTLKHTYQQPYLSIISSILLTKDSEVIEVEKSHTDHERGSDDHGNYQPRVTTPGHPAFVDRPFIEEKLIRCSE